LGYIKSLQELGDCSVVSISAGIENGYGHRIDLLVLVTWCRSLSSDLEIVVIESNAYKKALLEHT